MRIFFICRRVPFPPNRGDKITTFNEIRHLARTHDVHVFCLGDNAKEMKDVAGLREYAKTVTVVRTRRVASLGRVLAALINGQALSVAAIDEPVLHAAIQQKHHELKPDLIMIYSGNFGQYAEHFPQTARLMQFADLDSLKWGQYAKSSPPPLKWVYRVEQQRMLAYERRIAAAFSHSLVCTANEQRDFVRLIPGVPVSLVGNGVDLDFFRPLGHAKHTASLIFTGVMNYWPNIDAAVWFFDEILPLIRRQVPETQFVVCGSHPVRRVRRLATRSGVTVTGWVADTRPYLDESEVFVAPLRLGRGIQNKVLEAMAMGLPVVSSVAAWRGTTIPQGDGILATDDRDIFADHVVRLLQDADYRSDIGRKARRAVEAHYHWEAQLKPLDRVIDSIRREHVDAKLTF